MKILICCLILLFPLFAAAQCKGLRTAEQTAAWSTLPPEQKAVMFTAHLQRELMTRKLNGPQRETLDLGLSLITVDLYTQRLTKERMHKFAVLKRMMRANFSGVEGSEIFEQVKEWRPDAALFRDPREGGDCNCSTTWTWCSSGTCKIVPTVDCDGVPACNQVYNCGPFWGFLCNGMCCG